MFKSKFTNKEYRLYLKRELEDVVLTPPEEKTASKSLDVILRDKPEPVQQESKSYHHNSDYNLLPKVIPRLKYRYSCTIYTSFDKLWKKLPTLLALHIASFLPLKSALNFAGTCKTLNNSLKHKIYVQKLERHLNITLDYNSQNNLLNDTSFLRSFYKSLYYSLAPESVFSTKTMLQNNSAIQGLAKDLIDISTITNLKTIQTLEGHWKKLWSPTIMLSSISGRVTLWTLFRSSQSSSLHILFEHSPPNSQNIVSLRLISADFLVIQTREKTTLPGFAYIDEFAIVDINQWIEAMDGGQSHGVSVKEFEYSFQVGYKTNPTGNDFIQDDESQGNFSQYFVCHEGEKRPFFYIKESTNKTILSISNLLLKKLEAPLLAQNSADDHLPTIIAPKKGELLALSKDLKVKVLAYDKTDQIYRARELHYSGKIFDNQSSNELFCYQKCQLGSFTDKKGNLVQYLLILKNNEFFFIDINSLMSRKSLTVIPENGSMRSRWYDKDPHGTVILGRSVTSWHAHENKIAMALNNTHLVVFEIDSQGEFTKISADKQLLVSQSKWECRSQAAYDFTEKPVKYAQELERSKLPLYIFINNSHLVIVSFPTISQNFCIYFASLPEILFSKNSEIWNSQKSESLPALNIQRTKWEISSQDIFNQDPKSFFRDCNKHENYQELLKFENNQLLLKLGSLNLYFDFECLYNFDPIPSPKRSKLEGSQTLQIDLPNELRLHHHVKTEEVNQNHGYSSSSIKSVMEKKKPAAKKKPKVKDPEPPIQAQEEESPSRKKKGKKHEQDGDEGEDTSEETTEAFKSKRQQRKEEFQGFKKQDIWYYRKVNYLPLRYLHHSVDLKEQFLKLINKRKETKEHDSF